MTRKEWLARCSTAYDIGLANDRTLLGLCAASDTYLRLTHVTVLKNRGEEDNLQESIAIESLRLEADRVIKESSESFIRTLANDPKLYSGVTLAALLRHPCQKCATDPRACHTRYGFCEHQSDVANGDAETQ